MVSPFVGVRTNSVAQPISPIDNVDNGPEDEENAATRHADIWNK